MSIVKSKIVSSGDTDGILDLKSARIQIYGSSEEPRKSKNSALKRYRFLNDQTREVYSR